MATHITINCHGCKQAKTVQNKLGQIKPEKCDDCIAMEQAKAKNEVLQKLKTLSIEERVALLEEWAYDSALDQRISISDMLV